VFDGAPMTTAKDSTFGRYEILAEVGRGAMGVVYKARDPKINRLVAIKTIAIVGQNSEQEGEYRERFFMEAQAAGQLSHPCIVTIFDVGEELDSMTPYIVMEYVEGRSLEDLLSEDLLSKEGQKIPVEESLALAQELAESMDYAHAHRIVHRDIKPANIIITQDGHPKIADFGIAKLNIASATTQTQVIGTPAYMSPEQLHGDPVDGRSDLFSLGCVLYTMLTGYRPFQGNSALTVSFKVVNREPVPVSALDSELSPDIDYIISRALAKDVSQRYQTGMEMALDLEDVRNGFLPRSTMGALPPKADIKQSSLDTCGLSTVKFSLPLPPRARGGSKIPQPSYGWPLWQYAAIAVMAIGVLGIASAMFRLPASIEIFRILKNEPVGPPSLAAPAPNREPAVPVPTAAAPSASTAELPKQDLADSTATPAPTKAVATPIGNKKTAGRKSKVLSVGKPATKIAGSESGSEQASTPARPSAQAALSTLHMRVEHHFPEARILMWIDDKLTYTHTLGGTVKKRLVVFKGVRGFESESFLVEAGNHNVRVRVQSSDNSYDQTANISGPFPEAGERALGIACGKHELKLTLQ